MQTLTAANGCDSTVTMYLTILHSDTVSVELIVCDSYEWNGITYTESGDYTQTLTAANGCDSVVKLHLTVNDCNAGIIVYPNPASNSLHIHIPDPAILEDEQDIYVFMYDAAGHLVFKQQIFTLDTELILPPLRNGLYPLEVNVNGKAMKTFKQVIFHEQ